MTGQTKQRADTARNARTEANSVVLRPKQLGLRRVSCGLIVPLLGDQGLAGLFKILNARAGTAAMATHPLIGIPADRRMVGAHPFHMVGEKYARAVMEAAGAAPLLIPALAEELRFDELLERLDGILFTGSPSNVEPHRYQGTPSDPGTLHDPARDATTLPLIRKAVDAGVPVFGICRGFQEMNVAFGGTLHQKVHQVPGRSEEHTSEL